MEDLMKLDLYELLNISLDAQEKEIKKAYRKKALSCHPDKNPDNPQAAELFQQLSKALEILSDKAARAAYDKVLNARKATQVRHRELDSKRKKLKEDLEAKERAAEDERLSTGNLQKEIERLRREGSKLLEEENERIRQQIEKEKQGGTENNSHPRLKVKWKSHKSDETNGGYNQKVLETIFQKYGYVICLVSSKKSGSAILEFSTPEAAIATLIFDFSFEARIRNTEMIPPSTDRKVKSTDVFEQLAFESEKGNPQNPLMLSWISGQPELPHNSRFASQPTFKGPAPEPAKDSALTSRDYESLVLMKMRQAEERKRLIEQMMEGED